MLGNGTVRGSVIQRSLIPEGLNTVLNVATVPVSELLAGGSTRNLRGLLGELLGMPETAILDADGYASLSDKFRDGGIFRPRYPGLWLEYWDFIRSRRAETPRMGEGPAAELAADALSLMVRPTRSSFEALPPFWMSEDDEENSEEELNLALQCWAAGATRNTRVRGFLKRVGEYDIPSGQSPKAQSDSLLKLIETSKQACFAPAAAGGLAGVSLLTDGQYVAALLTTGAGSVMTLMLIGTVSVADYLVHQVVRARKERPPPEHTPERGTPDGGPPSGGRGMELRAEERVEENATARAAKTEADADAEAFNPEEASFEAAATGGVIEDDDDLGSSLPQEYVPRPRRTTNQAVTGSAVDDIKALKEKGDRKSSSLESEQERHQRQEKQRTVKVRH